MEPAIVVGLLWLLFGGAHVGLATRLVRNRLVARLGERGFMGVFSLVAIPSFTLLVAYYATHRAEGMAGLALGEQGPFRWLLMGAIVLGVVLVSGSVVSYVGSPYAMGQGATPVPRGLDRITRHPMFAGVTLLGSAHVLLAPHLVGTVFMAGLTLLAAGGARHQDAKLRGLRGPAYDRYLAVTSTIPFVAILARRQRLAWHELPLGALVVGLGIAGLLRAVHGDIFAHGGAWFIGGVIGGGTILTFLSELRASRAGRDGGGAPASVQTPR